MQVILPMNNYCQRVIAKDLSRFLLSIQHDVASLQVEFHTYEIQYIRMLVHNGSEVRDGCINVEM